MSQAILDCSDSSYWQTVYETTLIAESITTGYHSPIPQHQIPIVFDNHTLAVGASSSKTKPTWNLGFWLSMLVNLPGVGNATAVQKAIPLGLNLIRFPVLTPEFKLKAKIPKWHEEMSMKFWIYTGPEADIADLLEKAQTSLDQIELKIDQP